MNFISSLYSITFLYPWILAALLVLPVIWFLLKVIPPAPKLISFPATHFLKDLVADDLQSQKTPLWLILLRLFIATLFILAMAHPVIKPNKVIDWQGDLRLVIDNSWASASNWQKQKDKALYLLSLAQNNKSQVYILPTAAKGGQDAPIQTGPVTAIEAERIVKGMKPQAWPASYPKLIEAIQSTNRKTGNSLSITSFWLSHGISEGTESSVIRALKNHGSVHIFTPEKDTFIPYIKDYTYSPEDNAYGINIGVAGDAPDTTPITLQALDVSGTVLDSQNVSIGNTEQSRRIQVDLPSEIKSRISSYRLSGINHAASRYLLDDLNKKRNVGIVTSKTEDDTTPLIEAEYYITKALLPFSEMTRGTVKNILDTKPSVIILPDIGALPLDDVNLLTDWVKNGGLLLRFAGPNMAKAAQNQQDILSPVQLSRSDRALDGALTWSTPLSIAPFEEQSPFYGIELYDDLKVKRQLLASTEAGLKKKTWASLSDGTPLVTANSLENGLLVLVHTTATPAWSDLALSGTFVKMLQRVLSLAGKSTFTQNENAQFFPKLLLDANGVSYAPLGYERPISAKDLQKTRVGPFHPPGLYGNTTSQITFHLGSFLSKQTSGGLKVPQSVTHHFYTAENMKDFMPTLLKIAALLFLIDWCVMIILQILNRTANGLSLFQRKKISNIAAFILFFGTTAFAVSLMPINTAQAQNTLNSHMDYSSDVAIGYVSTGNRSLDTITKTGLDNLTRALQQRTSVSISNVVMIDPETDALAFFPLIYWPVSPESSRLSPEAQRNVQYYLDNGGTILFDTRDQVTAFQSGPQIGIGRNAEYLRNITNNLSIPPLHTIPNGHVLTKTFYLLKGFPGKYKNGTLWIEKESENGRDGVSSVLIGGNDWASAWASLDTNGYRIYGRDKDDEMALRFGVNMIMYSLTGNYKDDQVHIPHILERLGQ